jgi:hypothetical protein
MWYKGKKDSIQIWCPNDMEGDKIHSNDCYFCCCDVKGYNSKNKKVILYPNLPGDVHASRSAGWLYQIPIFHL